MRLPWWARPYRTARVLRAANANQREMIDQQAHVSGELRTELREAREYIKLLTAQEVLDPPEWVIMGKRDGLGLAVLGSDKPTHAAMVRKVAGHLSPFGQTRPAIPVYENKVQFTTPDLTLIRCGRYDEGLQTLLEQWNMRGGRSRDT